MLGVESAGGGGTYIPPNHISDEIGLRDGTTSQAAENLQGAPRCGSNGVPFVAPPPSPSQADSREAVPNPEAGVERSRSSIIIRPYTASSGISVERVSERKDTAEKVIIGRENFVGSLSGYARTVTTP